MTNFYLSKAYPEYDVVLGSGKGFMFSFNFDRPLVFCFEKSFRGFWHMFFVFFTIDMVFLDDKNRVIELKEYFRPFHWYVAKKPHRFVLELDEGDIRRFSIKLGDRVVF